MTKKVINRARSIKDTFNGDTDLAMILSNKRKTMAIKTIINAMTPLRLSPPLNVKP